jgi:hypothetical protein
MSRFGATLRGLAAIAAAATAISVASPASAITYVKLISDSMNTTFQANISGHGNVYSNGVTFQAQASTAGGVTSGPVFDLFGFCVDVYHNIGLGSLGYVYASNQDLSIVNPLPTDFGGNVVSPTQLSQITNLVNTGYYLHQNEVLTNNFSFDTEMRLAAIQAAIWKIEVPSKTLSVLSANLNASQFTSYQNYFNDYASGNYTPLGDANDRFYVIADGAHQSFGIAWPIAGVPEPGTWLMMILGFGGVGAALRRRRQAATAFA